MAVNFRCEYQEKVKIKWSILLLGLAILLLDQLTKFLTYQFIAPIEQAAGGYPYGGIGIFKNFLGIEFSLNYMTNKGAAWGILGNYQSLLVFVRIGLILVLGVYLAFFNRHASWQIPLVLILTGALGNVIDFFVYGHVIDMFHFVLWGYDFPIFNLADSSISIGIGALCLISWLDS